MRNASFSKMSSDVFDRCFLQMHNNTPLCLRVEARHMEKSSESTRLIISRCVSVQLSQIARFSPETLGASAMSHRCAFATSHLLPTLFPRPVASENRRKLPVIGTYLRVTPRLRLRRRLRGLALSPEYSNCERQSQENTRWKFPAASSAPRAYRRYFNVPLTPAFPAPPTRQLLPFGNTYAISPTPTGTSAGGAASPPGLHSESKIKYLREMVNTVTGALPEVGKLEIGRVPLRRGTRRVFHAPSSSAADRDASFYFNNYVAARCSRKRKSIAPRSRVIKLRSRRLTVSNRPRKKRNSFNGAD